MRKLGFVVAAAVGTSVLALAPQAQADSVGEIDVVASCEAGGWVITSEKAIGGVVFVTPKGTVQQKEFGPLTDIHELVAPAKIVDLWVKAGDNDSGDGPGYGEHFDVSPFRCS